MKISKLLASLAVLSVLSGCSTLPRSGPYRSDLLDMGTEHPDVAVVELDAPAVAVLAAIRPPSLSDSFGDYRPPGEQRIGIGDSVQITVWEAGPGGLFSSPVVDRESAGSRTAVIPEQTVARDGAITVPFAGRVHVAGRTPPEVERAIVARLADKAIDPQALVSVTRNVSNVVTLVGDGGPGARVPLSVRGDRLLDVVASAGGLHSAVQDIVVVLARDGRTQRVPLQTVLDKPEEDVFLRPGDVVTLVHDPLTFTAMGATGRSGVVPFETIGLTLEEALGHAGGLLDDRADPAGLFVVRYEPQAVAQQLPQVRGVPAQAGMVPIVYHLNMRQPESLFLAHRFPMRNKDVLYVSNAPITDLQKVLNLVNLLVSPAVTGVQVNSVVK